MARSTFPSQNVQNTPDHFWKFRCRKRARRCGAKHISKSKVLKNDGYGALLDVEMSKKCAPLWREGRRCGTKHISKSKCTLDDGWPESVEEQGLLLLVLRHYITRQYIKDVL